MVGARPSALVLRRGVRVCTMRSPLPTRFADSVSIRRQGDRVELVFSDPLALGGQQCGDWAPGPA